VIGGARLIGGAFLLFFGAEWFVSGATALALALRIPQLLIALTVVAYGTSAPEIIVGVQASRAGHGDVALGNVFGSNIANIGLILALAVIIQPAKVDKVLSRRELPVLLLSTMLIPWVLSDGVVSRTESLVLLSLALIYTLVMVRAARSELTQAQIRSTDTSAASAAQAVGAPAPTSALRSALVALIGLVVLLVGGKLFVDGAVLIARSLGISDRLVGLTIVAIGTSLPELVTSAIAARRGHSDIAVGNVIGSNIFNVLVCLGAAGLAGTVQGSVRALRVELVSLFAMTLLVLFFIRKDRTISRAEGAVALLGYVVFTVVSVMRA
jgi:cation:H+ antiporter